MKEDVDVVGVMKSAADKLLQQGMTVKQIRRLTGVELQVERKSSIARRFSSYSSVYSIIRKPFIFSMKMIKR